MCVSLSGSEPVSEPEDKQERDSSFRLEISLAIGYQRRRATLGGVFEGHVVTVALLAGGIGVVAAFVFLLLRLLSIL